MKKKINMATLPMGDLRKVVSSTAKNKAIHDFLEYRIPDGELKGMPFGNLLLVAMVWVSQDINYSVEKLSAFVQNYK